MNPLPQRSAPHRNSGCRIRDYVWRGRRCLSLENEIVRIVVCIDKGCDILELTHKPTDTECLHQAPAGLSRPQDVFSSPLAAGAFRDLFPGGWYVMLPNGPEPCEHRGANYGHHGEATFLAWDAVIDDDHPDRISVRCHVRLRRTPVVIERRFTLERGSATVTLDEQITNEAPADLEVLWGHHPTFGEPLLEPGARIYIPANVAISTGEYVPEDSTLAAGSEGRWPLLSDRDGRDHDLSVLPSTEVRSHDFIRIDTPVAGWFAIHNPARDVGVALRWDEALFPMLGYWRLWGGGPDYPWYGARRMIALEPACDLPSLSTASAARTAIRLGAGDTRATRIEASLFTGPRAVVDVGWSGYLDRGTGGTV